MIKVIVSTTINQPTIAIRKFDAMKDWTLVVVGDQKTPEYKLERGYYLTPKDQEKIDPKLSDAIGWNCIQRRNMGFLFAMKEMNAGIVATVDDDNIPLDGWGGNLVLGIETRMRHYVTDLDAFDPLYATNHPDLWHRGFPIQLLAKRYHWRSTIEVEADVQADLWNGDPDVDAICRMQYGCPEFLFMGDFPFSSNKISPFNSQNTFLSAKVMPHYFMFPGVGRMDDIFASYHVQQQGFKVVYGEPSVYQKRNAHDLTADMKAEYLGYEHNLEIIKSGSVIPFLPERARFAFELYQKHYE